MVQKILRISCQEGVRETKKMNMNGLSLENGKRIVGKQEQNRLSTTSTFQLHSVFAIRERERDTDTIYLSWVNSVCVKSSK